MAGANQRITEHGDWEALSALQARTDLASAMPGCETVLDETGSPVRLASTVAREVIPRLVLAHPSVVVPIPAGGVDLAAGQPTRTDISEFARILLQSDYVGAVRYIDTQRTRGMSIETVYLDLLAPTARHLGEMWTEDRCHFVDVTMAMIDMQRILRELSPTFQSSGPNPGLGRHVLLAPAAGEQHTFGLLMVAEFFSRAGWIVTLVPSGDPGEIVDLARTYWFSVAGFSLSRDKCVDELAGTIRAIRRASRNPAMGVLVGGRAIDEHTGLVHVLGADATAIDGSHVALQARSVLNLLQTK